MKEKKTIEIPKFDGAGKKLSQRIVNFPNPCNALAVAHLSGCCWLWISETGTDLVDASSGYNFPYGLVV